MVGPRALGNEWRMLVRLDRDGGNRLKREISPPLDFPVYEHLCDTLPEEVWDEMEMEPYILEPRTAITYLARRLNGETAVKD